MYHDKMLATTFRGDWIFGEWSNENWKHERCHCQLITLKSGEKRMFGGHRDRYFGHNGRSRKSRRQERRQQRTRENRLVRLHVLDETI